jgi:isocitrate dehydrogenase
VHARLAGAACLVTQLCNGLDGAFGAKTITYDFHRSMEGAKLVNCSGFATEVIPVIKHV